VKKLINFVHFVSFALENKVYLYTLLPKTSCTCTLCFRFPLQTLSRDSKFRYVDFLILSSDRSECFGKERFVGYFEIKLISIKLVRAAFAEQVEFAP